MKILNRTLVLMGLTAMIATYSSALGGPILGLNPANEFDGATGFQLAVSATEAATGANKTLALVGEGVRVKQVIGLSNIYLAQFFAENPAKVNRDGGLTVSSLNDAGVMAIRMTFSYLLVPIGKVVGAFSDALNINMTDAEQATFADAKEAFLNAVTAGGAGKKGRSITILGFKKADGTESVVFEDQAGNDTTIDSKAPGFVNKIFAIWFGNIDPNDAGLIDLKTQLLKQPNVTPKAN